MASSNESIVALYAVRVGVGVCSSLSVLGACAIILSYAAFPELRTIARQMLLNLSITDILLSLASLLGLIQNAGILKRVVRLREMVLLKSSLAVRTAADPSTG